MISAITTRTRIGSVPEGTRFNLTDPRGNPLRVAVFAGMPAGGRSYLLRLIVNGGAELVTLEGGASMYVYISDDGKGQVDVCQESQEDGWQKDLVLSEEEYADRLRRWCAMFQWDPSDLDMTGRGHPARTYALFARLIYTLPPRSFTGTLFFDTPETGLHPQIARGLSRLLRDEWPNGQVIVATNEPGMWDGVSSYQRWFFAPPTGPRSSWREPA